MSLLVATILSRTPRNVKLQHILSFTNQIRKFSSNDDGKIFEGLILGIYKKESENDEPKLTACGEKFDERVQGRLTQLIKDARISGVLGKGKVFNNVDPEFQSIAVIGLGQENIGYNELEEVEEGMENVRIAAGVGAKKLAKQGCCQIHIDSMEYAEQAAEGSSLAIWLYQDNKRERDILTVPKLELFESTDTDAWMRGLFKAEAQNLARRLCDAPANQMTPTVFAHAAVDALYPCGVNVEVRNLDWIESENMNSFLTVARSSCEPPILLEISYCGGSTDEKPILLVGNGLTFNSGGLCLKDKHGMDEYRASMAGAASVVATMRAASALSLPINIVGIVPLCENMPSAMAIRPGDVVTCLNGKNLAIHDTNNAEVIMMADPLLYAQNAKKPKLIIDVATLSKGVQQALGGSAAGVFTKSDFLWEQIRKAGALTGDRVWRLPLWNYYTKRVTSFPSFDLSNKGYGFGSACLGAAMLKEFILCDDWAHIDVTGVGMLADGDVIPYLTKDRMTGRPTRTLIQFLYQMACPEEQERNLKDN